MKYMSKENVYESEKKTNKLKPFTELVKMVEVKKTKKQKDFEEKLQKFIVMLNEHLEKELQKHPEYISGMVLKQDFVKKLRDELIKKDINKSNKNEERYTFINLITFIEDEINKLDKNYNMKVQLIPTFKITLFKVF